MKSQPDEITTSLTISIRMDVNNERKGQRDITGLQGLIGPFPVNQLQHCILYTAEI